MKRTTLILLGLLALCSPLAAEKIDLTRQQASELYVALVRIEPGLAAANAITVADNINELRPVAEALDKGKVAAQRQIRALPKSDDQEAKAQVIVDAFDLKAADPVKLDLMRVDLTPDEITAAKIPPGQLAIIRLRLKPKK